MLFRYLSLPASACPSQTHSYCESTTLCKTKWTTQNSPVYGILQFRSPSGHVKPFFYTAAAVSKWTNRAVKWLQVTTSTAILMHETVPSSIVKIFKVRLTLSALLLCWPWRIKDNRSLPSSDLVRLMCFICRCMTTVLHARATSLYFHRTNQCRKNTR